MSVRNLDSFVIGHPQHNVVCFSGGLIKCNGRWIAVERIHEFDRNQRSDAFTPIAKKESHVGLMAKTGAFAKRCFTGSLGVAIPLAIGLGIKYFTCADVKQTKQMYELGLYTGCLGFASAAVTSTSSSAFSRGIMFGLVAQLTSSLGGIGEGKTWDKVSQALQLLLGVL